MKSNDEKRSHGVAVLVALIATCAIIIILMSNYNVIVLFFDLRNDSEVMSHLHRGRRSIEVSFQ